MLQKMEKHPKLQTRDRKESQLKDKKWKKKEKIGFERDGLRW